MMNCFGTKGCLVRAETCGAMGEPKTEVKELHKEDAKPQMNKNGKRGGAVSGASFFTWFMVLALLGVWSSVAVVYFDLVDYQGVLAKAKNLRFNISEILQGKLSLYDADGDGDFDVEDAKVLLEDTPGDLSKKIEQPSHTKHAGLKLREALKEQLTIIHERVEARKIAKMALAEVRSIMAREEEEEKVLEKIRGETECKAWERAEARLREEGERLERDDVEKAMEKIRREKREREKKAEKIQTQEEGKKETNEKEKLVLDKAADIWERKPEKDGKEAKKPKNESVRRHK